jgi:hypothetical protein
LMAVMGLLSATIWGNWGESCSFGNSLGQRTEKDWESPRSFPSILQQLRTIKAQTDANLHDDATACLREKIPLSVKPQKRGSLGVEWMRWWWCLSSLFLLLFFASKSQPQYTNQHVQDSTSCISIGFGFGLCSLSIQW